MNNPDYAEAQRELRTLLDIIRWGASRLQQAHVHFGHGTDNAWDEALAITLPLLHLPFDINSDAMQARLTESERETVLQGFLERIVDRKPAAYITEQAMFAGLPFYVDDRVLIPRSPIAELIEQHFQPWTDGDHIHHVLDLCTGSGCIAIAVAAHLPHTTVDAADISDDAITIAERNIKKYGLEDRVIAIESNLFAAIPAQEQYDLIISNPPYVNDVDLASMPPEYHHEPRLGLVGGADGLNLVKTILQQAGQYLRDNGLLIVEVGNSAEALEQTYPQVAFNWVAFERGGDGVFILTKQQCLQHEW